MAKHILPIIARNKDNQAMKFSQLTAYNISNIVFEKSYTKCPVPYLNKQN